MNKLRSIGMITSYPGLTQSDWLWQQTPHAFGVWNTIQMLAQDPKPDFLLLYNFNIPGSKTFPQPKFSLPWKRTPTVPFDPQTTFRNVPKDRILYLMREPPLAELVQVRPHKYALASQYCGYVSGPDDYAPTPNYMPAIWYHANAFRELATLPAPEKVKPCSWITSGISRTANHRQRLDFLRSLQTATADTRVSIDFYGRNLPDWVKTQGQVKNKWHSMAPYTYNLAIENYTSNAWYVSEKLWDALLAWCLPIYWGGPAADRLIPSESFLRLPSLDEKGIAYIQEVIRSPDLWHDRQAAIAEAREIILHKLNLLNWLSEFVDRHT